jgi:hypothetical protein
LPTEFDWQILSPLQTMMISIDLSPFFARVIASANRQLVPDFSVRIACFAESNLRFLPLHKTAMSNRSHVVMDDASATNSGSLSSWFLNGYLSEVPQMLGFLTSLLSNLASFVGYVGSSSTPHTRMADERATKPAPVLTDSEIAAIAAAAADLEHYLKSRNVFRRPLNAVLQTSFLPEQIISFLSYMGRFFNSVSETAQKALSMFNELSKHLASNWAGGLSGLVGLGTFISMYKLYGDAIGDFGNRMHNALVAWGSSVIYLFRQNKRVDGLKELFLTPLSLGLRKSNTRALMNDFIELEEEAQAEKMGHRARVDFILRESAHRLAHRNHLNGKNNSEADDLKELTHYFQLHYVKDLHDLQVDSLLAAFAKSNFKEQWQAVKDNPETAKLSVVKPLIDGNPLPNGKLIYRPAAQNQKGADALTLSELLQEYKKAAQAVDNGRYSSAAVQREFARAEEKYAEQVTYTIASDTSEVQAAQQRLAHAEHGCELLDLVLNKAEQARRYGSYKDEAFISDTIKTINEFHGQVYDLEQETVVSKSGSLHEQLANAEEMGIRPSVLRKIEKGERRKVANHFNEMRQLLEDSLDRELYTAFMASESQKLLIGSEPNDLGTRQKDVCRSWYATMRRQLRIVDEEANRQIAPGSELSRRGSPVKNVTQKESDLCDPKSDLYKRVSAVAELLIDDMKAKGLYPDGLDESSVLHNNDRQKLLDYVFNTMIESVRASKEKAWAKLHQRTRAWLFLEDRRYWFQKGWARIRKATGSSIDVTDVDSDEFKSRKTAVLKAYEQIFGLNLLPLIKVKIRDNEDNEVQKEYPNSKHRKPKLKSQTQIWRENKEHENPNWFSRVLMVFGFISGTISALANGALGSFAGYLMLQMPSVISLSMSAAMQYTIMGIMFGCGFTASILLTRVSVQNSFMDFGVLIKEGSKNFDTARKKRLAWTALVVICALLAGVAGGLFAYLGAQTFCTELLINAFHWSLSGPVCTVISGLFGGTTAVAIASLMGRICHAEGLYLGRVAKGKEQLGWNKLSTMQKGLSLFATTLAVALGIGTGFTGVFGALKVIGELTFITGSAVPVVNVFLMVAAVAYGALTFGMVMRPLQEKLVLGDGNWKNFTTAQKGLYFLSLATGALYRFGPMVAMFVLPLAFGMPITLPFVVGSLIVMVALMAVTKVIDHFLQVKPDPTPEDNAMLMVLDPAGEVSGSGLGVSVSPSLEHSNRGTNAQSHISRSASALGLSSALSTPKKPPAAPRGNQFATVHGSSAPGDAASSQQPLPGSPGMPPLVLTPTASGSALSAATSASGLHDTKLLGAERIVVLEAQLAEMQERTTRLQAEIAAASMATIPAAGAAPSQPPVLADEPVAPRKCSLVNSGSVEKLTDPLGGIEPAAVPAQGAGGAPAAVAVPVLGGLPPAPPLLSSVTSLPPDAAQAAATLGAFATTPSVGTGQVWARTSPSAKPSAPAAPKDDSTQRANDSLRYDQSSYNAGGGQHG